MLAGLNHGVNFLLLDGVLLLEHSGVDKIMPLLTICSMVPSRVNLHQAISKIYLYPPI